MWIFRFIHVEIGRIKIITYICVFGKMQNQDERDCIVPHGGIKELKTI